MSDIVERLLALSPLAIEAATAIEARDAEIARLREALAGLVKINEQHAAALSNIMGKPVGWKDTYLDAARAALKVSP